MSDHDVREFEHSLGWARQEMRKALDADIKMRDFDATVTAWAKLGNDLRVYGTKHGLDVSRIEETMKRLASTDDDEPTTHLR